MSYMPTKVFSVATMASDVTLSTYVALPYSFHRAYLEVPTMTSGCNVYVQGCATATGTYRRICNAVTAVTGATPVPWNVNSSITQTVVELPLIMPFMKVELSTAMTATSGVEFKIICVP
jgi:hypothetical protein